MGKKKKSQRKGAKKAARTSGARLSLRAFAAHLDVSRHAVQKALRVGRLTPRSYTRNARGHYAFDVELAASEWEGNAAALPNEGGGRGRRKPAPAEKVVGTDLYGQPILESDREETGREAAAKGLEAAAAASRESLVNLQSAKLELEIAQRKLDLRRAAGELVSAAAEAQRGARIGSEVLARLEQIPERVSDELAATRDANVVQARLTEEIHDAVRNLVDELGGGGA